MKRISFQNEVDNFAIELIRSRAEQLQEKTEPSTPFFMTRLQARILREQQVTQFWEFGVISAQKWLVALSCIALLFFFGNLIIAGTQSQLLIRGVVESSQYEPEDVEDVHSEALNVDMLQKE